MIYMRARYYDPQTGRFMSEDNNGSGINWFAYCNNNPINAVDPDGQQSLKPEAAPLVIFNAYI